MPKPNPVVAGKLPKRLIVACVAIVYGLLSPVFVMGEAPEDLAAKSDFFESQVRPLLISQCADCHGAEEQSAGLRVDSLGSLLRGGDTGPALVPGDVESSLLVQAIRQTGELRMPPDSRLNSEQVGILERWIAMGAVWPADGPLAQQSDSDVARRQKEHWAFQLVADPPLPTVVDAAWCRNPVDMFVLAQLEAKGMRPSPRADRRTLIRRTTYDLTGLPPTLSDVQDFLTDPATDTDAYERLIERLLDSPQYGVHWARKWLDVARYSDTKGYVPGAEERNFIQSAAYRDWVVDAFNNDLPYDRFLLLQIAADQVAPDDPQALAAMGFLTLGRRFLGITHEIIDDRIDVLTRGTMGLTVACARCHDHKYDPIPTADYYSLYGVFQNCKEQQVRIADPPISNDASHEAFEAELKKREAKRDEVLAEQIAAANERVRRRCTDYLLSQLELHKYPEEGFGQVLGVDDIQPMFVRRWQAFLAESGRRNDAVMAAWHRYAQLPTDDFAGHAEEVTQSLRDMSASSLNPMVAAAFQEPPGSMREVAERYGQLLSDIEREWQQMCSEAKEKSTEPPKSLANVDAEAVRQVLYAENSPCRVPHEPIVNIEFFFDRATRETVWNAQSDFDRWLIQSPQPPTFAVALVDRTWLREPRVFRRGNPANKGEQVPRRFLSLMAGTDAPAFAHGSGRMELARSIADPQNPLTPRVWVNRIWMHHFGSGLVDTPSDFGVRADPPSHPELLDWLARQSVEQGWSTKSMHRYIMLSNAYQQVSGGFVDTDRVRQALEVDPVNRLLWRMNATRLTFEELRDTLLATTHELDLRRGGKATVLFPADDRNVRRTLYGIVDRQYLPTVHRMFDFASPDLHIAQRTETMVPQQALFALNHPFLANRARALVLLTAADADDITKLDHVYREVYQREPTTEQRNQALAFLHTASDEGPTPSPTAQSLAWQYGFGRVNETVGRLDSFQTFPQFSSDAWNGGLLLPSLEELKLTAEGGNAGNEKGISVIRRWTAPTDLVVSIQSSIEHQKKEGDGIQCWIVSSQKGILGSAKVHNAKATMNSDGLTVTKGETIDFVVYGHANSEVDDFLWGPVIRGKPTTAVVNSKDGGEVHEWNSTKDFTGPTDRPLNRWEQVAQVLMMSNEFMFVD
ncbi:MAG: PSD1 and planctomycete cytochrome C domain-containing protein [Planctomycetota bacterium]|nr:PSD1 and planctomycete cytochrome C domain-containing protein [Planctomycetota bacterium]